MWRYLVGMLGTGINALPWVVGGVIVAPTNLARWVHPITVRPVRTFGPRVRLPRVESGHRETGTPVDDD